MRLQAFAVLAPVESGESEVSEAAVTAAPAQIAGCPGPAENWHWLTSAAEMATRTPGAGAESVRAARDFTGATLRRWGIGERGGDIVCVVSELLTNALRYTMPCPGSVWPRWPVRLGLLQPGPWVLCAISDPSDEVPVAKDPGWFGESGRGLHVVGSLCDEWGCTEPGPMGKVVWAMFATSQDW